MSIFKYLKKGAKKETVPPKPKPAPAKPSDEELVDSLMDSLPKKTAASPGKVKPGVKRKKKSALVIDSSDDEDFDDDAPAEKKKAKAEPRTKSPAKAKSPKKATAAAAKSPKKKATAPKKTKSSTPKKARDANDDEDNEHAAPSASKKAKSEEPAEEKPKKKWNPYQAQNRAGPPLLGQKPLPEGPPYCLFGETFLCTGVLESLEREQAHDLIMKYGGEVAKSVVKKLTYAVVGNEPGESKLKKIKEKDIPIIDEDGLFALIRDGKERKPTKQFLEKRRKAERIAKEGKEQKPEVVEAIKAIPAASTAAADAPAANASGGEPAAPAALAQEMWTTKYAPKKSSALIANPGAIGKVRDFLNKWKNPDVIKNKSFKRAVLISGVPGIGKSTTAALLAREAGYDVLEYNASDARSKKRLREEGFMEIGGNRSLNEFFAPENKAAPHNKRTVVIMDEVDGMGGGDRGGNQELIAMIKQTRIPIICICNDRQKNSVKSLANYCEDVRFMRPQAEDIAGRMRLIMNNEGFEHVDMGALKQLCSSVNNDIRQVLNLLQMLRLTTNRLDGAADAFQSDMALGRHVEQNVFNVTPQLFSGGPKRPSQALDLFFHDYDLMPLMIEENYLRVQPARPPQAVMQAFANAADLISYGDLVKHRIMSSGGGQWSLLPIMGMVSTVIPAAEVRGRAGRVEFPSWLGKNSNANKQKRLLKEVQVHMSAKTGGANKFEVRLDYIPALLEPLVRPLIEHGQDGIDTVMALMDDYNLSKDDWETLFMLAGKEKDITSLDSKLKAAFTRKYNKTHQKVSVAPVSSKKGKGGSSRIADDSDGFLNQEAADEYAGEDDEEDEQDAGIGKNDVMIKTKKPKAAAKKKPAAKRQKK